MANYKISKNGLFTYVHTKQKRTQHKMNNLLTIMILKNVTYNRHSFLQSAGLSSHS